MIIAGNENWFFRKWFEKPFTYWHFEPVSNFTPSIRNSIVLYNEQAISLNSAIENFLKVSDTVPYLVTVNREIMIQNSKFLYNRFVMLVYDINPKQDFKVHKVDKETGKIEISWNTMPDAAVGQQIFSLDEMIKIAGLKPSRPDNNFYKENMRILNMLKTLKNKYHYNITFTDIQAEKFACSPAPQLEFAFANRDFETTDLVEEIKKKTGCDISIDTYFDKFYRPNYIVRR